MKGDVNQPLGGSLWAGFSLVAKSPYLLSIAAFVLLLTWVSTFLYLQQAELVQKALPDRDQQTQLFGWVDFIVQSLSLLIQLFVLSRFTKWMRLSTVIMMAPILMVFGYSALALFPVLSVLLVVMVIRRVGEYALVRPCREMLFTSRRPRNEIQGEELHRHGGLSNRRCDQRLGARAALVARSCDLGYRVGRRCGCGGVGGAGVSARQHA